MTAPLFFIVVLVVISLFPMLVKKRNASAGAGRKRIVEIMKKGGYIVQGEDASGNLSFTKVETTTGKGQPG